MRPAAGDRGAFADRAVVVTGAATGIGWATARAFTAAGARTFGIVRRRADIPVGRGGEACDPVAEWLVADVADPDAVAVAVQDVEKAAGGIDVLVSNAGVARHGSLPEMSHDDVELVVSTNLIGFFNLLRSAVPLLRPGSAVVAISSVHALATASGVAVYAATKAGIVAAVRAAALDHGRSGIRVNAVLPGSVDTPMLQASALVRSPQAPEQALAEWAGRHALGRILQPDEVASAVLFLAGPMASGITGVALPVDGGLLARLAL